jgi:hypothetical protein
MSADMMRRHRKSAEQIRDEIVQRVPGSAMVRVRAFLRAEQWQHLAEFFDANGLHIRVTTKTSLELAALVVDGSKLVDWRYDHDFHLAGLQFAPTPEQDEGTSL